jgi:hypothetical protein
MFRRARRELRSRIGRWLLYPVLAVLMIAAIGGGYQTVRESLDAKAYPRPSQLIDVGGHRLHLYCTGSGSPTAVLEAGGGASSSDFAWIAPAVARDTRVCVCMTAPVRGWSDAADGPQDGGHIAADLHALLERAQVPGPLCWPVIPSAACTFKASPRMHLDLESDDVEGEVRRLEALGAARWDHQRERATTFVLRDPWANEFCVLQVNFPNLLNGRPAWPS